MIKMLTAHTTEIDDVEVAVADILEQLDLEHNKKANMVGVINCYSEFIESGVVRALTDALGFDVIGCTSIATAVNGACGMMQLSLSVLASDDIVFSTARTEDLNPENMMEPMEKAYQQACGGREGKPAWMLTYLPLFVNLGGQQMLDVLGQVTGEVPVYGTIACDHTLDLSTSQVIHNGEGYSSSMVMLLFWGDTKPTFLITTISKALMQKQRSLITKAEGNLLLEVNELPFKSYMDSIGLSSMMTGTDMSAMPIMVDLNDGSEPLARCVYSLTEEGYAVLGGMAKTNATMTIGAINHDDVLLTSQKLAQEALAKKGQGGMFVIPCISRALVLGADVLEEAEIFVNAAEDSLPMQLIYSAGEICPVLDKNGNLINRFHNFACIICMFD